MSLPDTSVKFFSSDMSGAPALSGTAGALIGVLDACLVNGFGAVTVSSLVVADNVATATVSAGHNFSLVGGAIGPVIRIEEATPAALNGEWRIATVPNSTTFTFATSGVDNGTATGTITAKRAAAGWQKRYSDTTKAVYARLEPSATTTLLRVDDAPAQYPTLTMYESMTDVDAGFGASSVWYSIKSNLTTTAAREWRVFADDSMMYCFIKYDGSTWYGNTMFGDINKVNLSDAFNCMICGLSSASQTSGKLHLFGTATGEICRGYAQTGGSASAAHYGSALQTNRIGSGGMSAYPNPVDNCLHLSPILVFDAGYYRGVRPGMYSPLHDGQPGDGTVVGGVLVGDSARDMFAQYMITSANKCVAMLDLTGPWR